MENIKLFTCPICGKIYSSEECKKPKLSLTHHQKFCEWRKKVLDYFNLTINEVETLLDKYGSVQNFKRNLPQELQLNSTSKWYYEIFKENGIDTSIKKASNAEATKKQRENTNLEKYGSPHNFCKDHPSRKAWEARLLKEEGITNVFQRESVKQKITETMLKKYGVEHPAQSNDFVVTEAYFIKKYGEEIGKKMWNELCYNKGKSMRLEYYIEKYGEEDGPVKYAERVYSLQLYYDKKSSKISSLNKKFKNLLDNLNIDYEEEYCLWLDEVTPRFYDFKIGKTIIELNGDFWHANPNKYKADDILNHPGSNGIKAKDIWKRD